ncbi:putative sodium:solute symporter, subfamily [compost metagenome]
MMGIFSRTVTDKGAIAGMLAGLGVVLFYVFAHKGIFFIKGTDFVDMVGGVNGFFTITPEAFGTVGAIVNFAVAYAVSKVSAPVPKHIVALVESVRVPKGAGAATAH